MRKQSLIGINVCPKIRVLFDQRPQRNDAMAEDPIALLERICRLESSMDPSMVFEEGEPTVRMGQDGFALALTQAKLTRLEVPIEPATAPTDI